MTLEEELNRAMSQMFEDWQLNPTIDRIIIQKENGTIRIVWSLDNGQIIRIEYGGSKLDIHFTDSTGSRKSINIINHSYFRDVLFGILNPIFDLYRTQPKYQKPEPTKPVSKSDSRRNVLQQRINYFQDQLNKMKSDDPERTSIQIQLNQAISVRDNLKESRIYTFQKFIYNL